MRELAISFRYAHHTPGIHMKGQTVLMNRHATSSAWAALITFCALGNLVTVNSHSSWWLIRTLFIVPSFPAALIIGYLGLGHGPDGFPTGSDVVLYVLTFLLWWGVVELIRSIAGRLRAQ
ncbi:MAG TPA: hypothetical protein VFL67_13840 [Mycobacterium sp.]|nr:hypothetical protein [Mycobacterium sp.]